MRYVAGNPRELRFAPPPGTNPQGLNPAADDLAIKTRVVGPAVGWFAYVVVKTP